MFHGMNIVSLLFRRLCSFLYYWGNQLLESVNLCVLLEQLTIVTVTNYSFKQNESKCVLSTFQKREHALLCIVSIFNSKHNNCNNVTSSDNTSAQQRGLPCLKHFQFSLKLCFFCLIKVSLTLKLQSVKNFGRQ